MKPRPNYFFIGLSLFVLGIIGVVLQEVHYWTYAAGWWSAMGTLPGDPAPVRASYLQLPSTWALAAIWLSLLAVGWTLMLWSRRTRH